MTQVYNDENSQKVIVTLDNIDKIYISNKFEYKVSITFFSNIVTLSK